MDLLGRHDSGGDATSEESGDGEGIQGRDGVRAAALTLTAKETLRQRRAAKARVAEIAAVEAGVSEAATA